MSEQKDSAKTLKPGTKEFDQWVKSGALKSLEYRKRIARYLKTGKFK